MYDLYVYDMINVSERKKKRDTKENISQIMGEKWYLLCNKNTVNLYHSIKYLTSGFHFKQKGTEKQVQ